jgi:redox-sensitive bicupin YhaK (pirin superfamily)
LLLRQNKETQSQVPQFMYAATQATRSNSKLLLILIIMVVNTSHLHSLTAVATSVATSRSIVHRTFGRGGHGPITRLMSPSDLGKMVKPFVFLDIFGGRGEAMAAMDQMPLHPHSGISTITVITEGHLFFNDPDEGSGKIDYGGVEWMRASGGVWHGKEMSVGPNPPPDLTGFQLWVALPPELENGLAVSRYIESKDMKTSGPATIIVGQYEDVQSPVPSPEGYNYLLVTLKPGEKWTYSPPAGHTVAWLAVSKGTLEYGNGKDISKGEMVVFEDGEEPLELLSNSTAGPGATATTFVLGSAVPHPYPLHLGSYSVHTSDKALRDGERKIKELGDALGDRKFATGTVPVFRK